MYLVFGFDKWHVRETYEFRPYKKVVVRTVNQLHPCVVVEIGCGLGEILSKVDAGVKVGVDTDRGVVRAARWLNWHKHTSFLDGSFNAVKDLPFDQIDALIMVNWLHNVAEERVRTELSQLSQRKKIRYLLQMKYSVTRRTTDITTISVGV